MKTPTRHAPAILLGLALLPFQQTQAATLVNDSWLDGSRAEQESGTDADTDGNIESAWFGTNGTLTASTGKLTGTVGAGSSSWTTYFSGEGSETTLANAGDTLTVNWTFVLSGLNATNNSQGMRLALVNTPGASRLAADGNPGAAAYAGYGMFMNVAETLGHTNPFQLMERTDNAASSALLSSSGSWTGLDDQSGIGDPGYVNGTSYTLVMTLTLTAASELQIYSAITGGSLSMEASFLDATPNSLSFDTFSLRPSSATLAAATFETSAFSVTLTSIPEPSAFAALAGAAGLALAGLRRRRR